MTVRIVLLLAFVFSLILPLRVVAADEWYVDGSAAQSGDGISWESAF
jgi:hypothetical protein